MKFQRKPASVDGFTAWLSSIIVFILGTVFSSAAIYALMTGGIRVAQSYRPMGVGGFSVVVRAPAIGGLAVLMLVASILCFLYLGWIVKLRKRTIEQSRKS